MISTKTYNALKIIRQNPMIDAYTFGVMYFSKPNSAHLADQILKRLKKNGYIDNRYWWQTTPDGIPIYQKDKDTKWSLQPKGAEEMRTFEDRDFRKKVDRRILPILVQAKARIFVQSEMYEYEKKRLGVNEFDGIDMRVDEVLHELMSNSLTVTDISKGVFKQK